MFTHIVSAWATSNQVVLGQVKTDEKSNEITAIPELLKLLNISGCTVTIDAMGCQKEIARQIVERDADYILPVKQNQRTLYDELEALFSELDQQPGQFNVDVHETCESGHGRHEVRRCTTTDLVETLKTCKDWAGLSTVIRIESERTADGKTTIEHRYAISSHKALSAPEALRSWRAHWGIENGLHWVLDVAFREDDCRVRAGYAAQNLSVMRQQAVNLLNGIKDAKVGIKVRRQRAGWDHNFLLRVLTSGAM